MNECGLDAVEVAGVGGIELDVVLGGETHERRGPASRQAVVDPVAGKEDEMIASGQVNAQSLTLDFEPEEYKNRLARLRDEMGSRGLDAVVVLGRTNHRYLSGHWTRYVHPPLASIYTANGDSTLIWISEDDARARSWIEDVRTYPWATFPINGRALAEIAAEALSEFGAAEGRIGLEMDGYGRGAVSVSVGAVDYLRSLLPRAKWQPADAVLQRLRVLKSPAEVSMLRRVAELTEQARDLTYDEMFEGMTELELQDVVSANLLRCGSHNLTFVETMHLGGDVAWTDRPFVTGEAVYMDLGGEYKGYASDRQRCASLGEPSDDLREGYKRLLELHDQLLDRVQPGLAVAEFTRYCFDAIPRVFGADARPESGWSGHGTGLAAMEAPVFGLESEHTFEPGMTVVIEPRVLWRDSWWTTEDCMLVTDTGAELVGRKTEPELRVVELKQSASRRG